MRRGYIDSPLHYGRAPIWLFKRMKALAKSIVEIMVIERGTEEVLTRLSDPFWFQAFGCVLGFDWHSSGVTTTVCGALKEGLKDMSKDIGIFITGGKGCTSRRTPEEIANTQAYVQKDVRELIYISKLAAKVDNSAVQDGYQLYHHTFIFNNKGDWSIIQQGMNLQTRYARRYHWLSFSLKNFVNEPHSAVCCEKTHKVLNMVAEESKECRETSVKIIQQNVKVAVNELEDVVKKGILPKHHNVTLNDINTPYLQKIFLKLNEEPPNSYEELLTRYGVGPKTIKALSLISELIYGKGPSFKDPATFSFAHGGKDGHPYPVDRKTYDNSIEFLKQTVAKAKIGEREKMKALKNLKDFYLRV